MFVFDLHKNVIVRFFIILSLFSISLNVNSQSERSVKTKTIGVGLGYSISSSIGDSVSPINLSLRYRLGQKHTFQFYVPFYLKRSRKEELPGNWKETNWGIGVGYDYLFYSHSLLDFIAGVKGNYWWYQDRYDEKATIPVYKGDQVLYVKKQYVLLLGKSRRFLFNTKYWTSVFCRESNDRIANRSLYKFYEKELLLFSRNNISCSKDYLGRVLS